MPLTGKTTFKIRIQSRALDVVAWIAPTCREPLILGYPWLIKHRGIHDYFNGLLYIGVGERFSIRTTDAPIPSLSLDPVNLKEIEQEFPENHLDSFYSLVQNFCGIFQTDGKLSQTQSTKHTIKLTSTVPFRIPLRQYSEEKREIIHNQVQSMLSEGIIEHGASPYSSPVVIVRKKDGKPRFCVDYRKLNSITEDVAQPIPRIHEVLKEIGTAKIFSTIDLKSGYWQIPMDEVSRKLTAFSTPDSGTYQFRVMPFGLKNAPNTFQKFMSQEVLIGLINKICIVYLDDIIIYSQDWHDHLQHLAFVFERLSLHSLTCAINKCHFGKQSLEFLGHNVTHIGNEAKDLHKRNIVELPTPTSKKQLQKLLGTCNWLREYVPHFATLLAPLTDLLLKNKRFQWTEEAQKAFTLLKQQMQLPLQLSRPDNSLQFFLQTDVSDVGMGAVLFQVDPEENRKILSYASAKFDQTQTRYSQHEKECLAIIWAIKRYKPYLEEKSFILRTDHRSLDWLDRMKTEKEKLARWALLLEEVSFTVENIPSRENELPDFLSRFPVNETTSVLDENCHLIPPEKTSPGKLPELFSITLSNLFDQIIEEQQSDPELGKLASNPRKLGKKPEIHSVDGGIWRKIGESLKLIVPENSKQRILYEYHDAPLAGHPGADETLRAIQDKFTWSKIRHDVREYVQQCHLCACTKASRPKHADQLRPHRPTNPWQTIAVDLMGPYPRTGRGKKFILVVTDLFSRWVEAFPIGSSDATVLIKILNKEVFARWGYPRAILSDNGPQFISKKWLDACDQWQAQHWTTAIYHPRANPTERRNQEIKKGLRLHLQNTHHKDWDLYLETVLFGLRTRKNAATGFTPSEVLLGINLKKPGEWRFSESRATTSALNGKIELVRANQEHYQKRYHSEIAEIKSSYQTGDLVYTKNHPLSNAAKGFHAGFAPKWEGPFPIVKALRGEIYLVERENKTSKYHGSQLKSAPPNPTSEPITALENLPTLAAVVRQSNDKLTLMSNTVQNHASEPITATYPLLHPSPGSPYSFPTTRSTSIKVDDPGTRSSVASPNPPRTLAQFLSMSRNGERTPTRADTTSLNRGSVTDSPWSVVPWSPGATYGGLHKSNVTAKKIKRSMLFTDLTSQGDKESLPTKLRPDVINHTDTEDPVAENIQKTKFFLSDSSLSASRDNTIDKGSTLSTSTVDLTNVMSSPAKFERLVTTGSALFPNGIPEETEGERFSEDDTPASSTNSVHSEKALVENIIEDSALLNDREFYRGSGWVSVPTNTDIWLLPSYTSSDEETYEPFYRVLRPMKRGIRRSRSSSPTVQKPQSKPRRT